MLSTVGAEKWVVEERGFAEAGVTVWRWGDGVEWKFEGQDIKWLIIRILFLHGREGTVWSWIG